SRENNFPSGLKLLAEGAVQPIVDIVLIHGLTGDRERTWRASSSTSPWPTRLLPAEIHNARILTFGYDAYVADWRHMVSFSRVGNHAMNLLTALATWREKDKTDGRPIIFVCHSLGGIVCQDALTTSQHYPDTHIHKLAQCTFGIIFFGTPHNGSGLAQWAEKLAKSINLFKQANSQILEVLKQESEVLARIQNSFHAFIRSRYEIHGKGLKITCFYEELPLPGIGPVVPLQSAIIPGYPSIGIHDNHVGMTKFENKNDPGFIALIGELSRWIQQIEPLDINNSGNAAAVLTDQAGTEQNQNAYQSSLQSGLYQNWDASMHEATAISANIQLFTDDIHFIPWRHRELTTTEIDRSLISTLQRPLGVKNSNDPVWVIYFGLVEGHPEFVKIGITSRDPQCILQQLTQDYGFSVSDIYTYKVNHIWKRLEALLSLELSNEQYRTVWKGKHGRMVYKVGLDKVQHILSRWFRLIDPATTPSLYDQHGQLHRFWYDRAQNIASSVSSTPEY
ncbi:hypothetical protein BDV37DRAFT_267426, partial [Aspergillus pseudonomiae]